MDDEIEDKTIYDYEDELADYMADWKRFIRGIETVLPSPDVWTGDADYKDWAYRDLSIAKSPNDLYLYDVVTHEVMRSWPILSVSGDCPILDMFTDAIVSWVAEHYGRPLSLVACLESGLSITTKGTENLWLSARNLDHDHQEVIVETFERFLAMTLGKESHG